MRLCSNCHNQPVFGTDRITKLGYCKGCQYKRTDLDRRSITVKGLEKAKKKAGWFDADKIEEPKEVKGGGELQRWFEDRSKEMTGICVNCGGKTQKGESNYKNSVAHILPKAYFKSVATHEDNWMELCFYGNSCHTNYDNKMIDILDLSCFDSVIQKFVRMYPHITKEERRRIPNVLLEYIETEI